MVSDLIFNRLGFKPEREAELLRNLCSSDGIDEAIVSEFPGTIAVYAQEPDEMGIQRIRDRYTGPNPLAVGSIVLLGGHAIGLAYSGIANFQTQGDNRPTSGINVSAWLSSQYRRNGIGKAMIRHAAHEAQEQSRSPEAYKWHNKQIWTSIKIGNLASIKVCESIGFVKQGVTSDNPDRLIYTLE